MNRHERLVCYVLKHSLEVFGEKIRWIVPPPKLERNRGPDLFGKDIHNKTVIVEVKSEFHDAANATNRRDAEHKSIGQVLDYVCAYMKKHSVESDRLETLYCRRTVARNS